MEPATPSTDMEDDPRLMAAHALVDERLKDVNEANRLYKDACTALGHLKVEIARERGHPWEGLWVWRSVDSLGKKRFEKGIVMFKNFGMSDFGNAHIPVGRWFVLTDKGLAKWLDTSWQLELV